MVMDSQGVGMSEEKELKQVEAVEKLLEKLPNIESMVSKLEILDRSGALDSLVELALTLKMFGDVITDDMVENAGKLVRDLGFMVDAITRSPLPPLVSRALNDPELDKLVERIGEEKVSLWKVFSLLRDEDTLRGLYAFLTVMKNLGRLLREKR